MTAVHVTFQPDGASAEVAPGTTLLDAAITAGLPLNGSCGGRGICERCEVVVVSGPVEALDGQPPLPGGGVLACRTAVLGDVVAEVPPASRIEGLQILTGADRAAGIVAALAELPEAPGVAAGAPGGAAPGGAPDPLALAVPVHLPRPTPDGGSSDLGLLERALRQACGVRHLSVPLVVARQVPGRIREAGRNVTAILGRRNGSHELLELLAGHPDRPVYGLAVDIGTTTIVVNLVDLRSGHTAGVAAALNGQVSLGEDVITRIIHAGEPGGLDRLRSTVVDEVNVLTGTLALRHRVDRHEIVAAVVAGNTTMIHLFLGLPPAEIRRDPYVPVATAPPTYQAHEVGLRIHPRGVVACMPGVGSYVGGDIVADVLASDLDRRPELTMLIDAGTNGEIVIGGRDFLVCCAASAGPAFEGGGISSGMRAANGAIDRVTIGDDGSVACTTVGDGPARGLCGSGLIDLLAELLRTGAMDRSGHLHPDVPPARTGAAGPEVLVVPAEATAVGRDITLTEADIETLLRSKAAIYAAAATLVRRLGLEMTDLERIIVAGGFGMSLDIEKAIQIGLLPDVPVERIAFIGNGSVAGARMALLSHDAWEHAAEIAGRMTYRDLSVDHQFMDEYVAALFLPHTDLHRFPRAWEASPVA